MVEHQFAAVHDGHGVVDVDCRRDADDDAVGAWVVAGTLVGLLDLGSGLAVAASKRRH